MITDVFWLAKYDEAGNPITPTDILVISDDIPQIQMAWPSFTHIDKNVQDWIDAGNEIVDAPEELPPLDGEASLAGLSVAQQGEAIWMQDERRRSVGATPILPDVTLLTWDSWMKSVYDAQDAGEIPPDPPVEFRRHIKMPGEDSGQCVITWHEFGGGWPGWGFKAEFSRADITALGLKVYDENDAYLYALTFTATDNPTRWVTETPAGFATPTKVKRSFEIIAGSAPVTDFLSLTDQVDYISLIVRWSPV